MFLWSIAWRRRRRQKLRADVKESNVQPSVSKTVVKQTGPGTELETEHELQINAGLAYLKENDGLENELETGDEAKAKKILSDEVMDDFVETEFKEYWIWSGHAVDRQEGLTFKNRNGNGIARLFINRKYKLKKSF